MSDVDFHFPKSPKRAVFTLQQVIHGHDPILMVFHDREEDDWQFLNGKTVSQKDMLVVPFAKILSHDPSLHTLANLPAGWCAVRKSTNHAWERKELFAAKIKS